MTRFTQYCTTALAATLSVATTSKLLRAAEPAAATTPAATPPATPAAAEAEYTRAIEKRADAIVGALRLDGKAKAGRVRDALVEHYRALRAWHDENDPELKKLKATAGEPVSKSRAEEIKATLKPVHDAFIERLSKDLSDEQVETVKDKLTYDVVRVTYAAFQDMLPQLTDQQKAKILETLKAGREEAMDGGSAEEKHAIFGRYKGRINNYLAAEGYDLKQASKDWHERQRAAKAAK